MRKSIIKTVALIAVFCTVLGCMGFAAEYAIEQDKMALLGTLGIMTGDQYGDYHLNDRVTRAEFTKMVVAASSARKQVASSSATSPFRDVPFSQWYTPYINTALENKFITGYPDSTFRPDNPVNLEESVTMALRLLGYDNSDFGTSWPYGQLGIAERIGLLDDVSSSIGQYIPRRDAMNLMYNLLTANPKQSDKQYLNTFSYQKIDDVTIISTSREDSSVPSDKVLTSSGTYKINRWFDYGNVGRTGSIVLNVEDSANPQLELFFQNDQTMTEYSIYAVLENDLLVLKGGNIINLGANNNTTTYFKSQKTTLQNVLPQIKTGYLARVTTNQYGVIDYIAILNSDLRGPITVTSPLWADEFGINPYWSTVLKDGTTSNPDNINLNDIVYYSTNLDTIYAYSKKVTGKYEKALPNREHISSVTVSGVEYSLETTAAFGRLSANGPFNIGDMVTLLLGRDGRVCDVIPAISSETYSVYSALDGQILIYKDGIIQDLGLDSTTTAYLNGAKTTLGAAAGQVQMGYMLSIIKNADGSVDYLTIITDTLAGPFTALDANWPALCDITGDDYRILKDGQSISATGVANYDIVYYSKALNIVFVYSKKMTGVYEKALPNKEQINSITLSGVTYELEGAAAFNALSSGGQFQINDTVTLLFGRNGKVADVVTAGSSAQETYIVYAPLSDDVLIYENGRTRSLGLDPTTTAYFNGVKETLRTAIPKLSPGYSISICRNTDGSVDYVSITENSLKGPYTVQSSNWISTYGINPSGLSILRDGKNVSASDIAINDIIYYSKELNMVWAYNKKVTGVYTNASPNKDSVTSITLSGVNYAIESSAAFEKLSSTGNIEFGETITLLLGKDGKIADVISYGGDISQTMIGYVLNSGQKQFTSTIGGSYMSYYVSVMLSDGQVFEYQTSRDYGNYKSQIVQVQPSGNDTKLSNLSKKTDLYGTVSSAGKTIGNFEVANNIEILDIAVTDNSRSGKAAKVFLPRLDGLTLNSSHVLYYETQNGKITKLLLNNVTGDSNDYGVMTTATLSESGGSYLGGNYEYDLNGTIYKVNSTNAWPALSKGMPVKIDLDAAGVMKNLTPLTAAPGTVQSIDELYVYTADSRFLLSDKVVVYKRTNDFKFLLMDMNDVKHKTGLKISAYYDRAVTSGGRVRILIVTD